MVSSVHSLLNCVHIFSNQLMDEAAKKLIGEHDYRNLCKMDVANGVTNFTRKILSAEINMTDEKFVYIVILFKAVTLKMGKLVIS